MNGHFSIQNNDHFMPRGCFPGCVLSRQLVVGGTVDYLHVLGRLGRTIALADWIKELKRASSIWVKTKDPSLHGFQWQSGYGAFSVSQSQCPRVQRYIASQEEHHRRFSFQQELCRLLEKHGVEFDERYVWD